MSKLAGKNQKWGRCHVPGHSDCGLTTEIRHPVSRSTEKSLNMSFERKLLEDPVFAEEWMEEEIEASRQYFVGRLFSESGRCY